MKVSLALLLALLTAAAAWSYTYIKNDKTGLPVKWDPGLVTLRVMLGSSQTLIDGTNYNSTVQAAAETWNALLGNMQFLPQSASVDTATDHNKVNEIVFAADIFGKAFGDTTLAVTTTWLLGNQRTESDVAFNTKWTWDSYRGPKRTGLVDLQRVAIHELGHSLGLDHPDEDAQTVSAVMNSRISDVDTVTTDDITGAQNLYGPPGVPANDKFANAIVITLTNGTAKVTGYNTNATKEPNEPKHVDNAGGHSVWWKWIAPAAGDVDLDTRGSYSDTTLAVYTGNALSTLTTIASNDDIKPGIIQASHVAFKSTAGTTYFIAVDGWDADSAGLTLNLSLEPTGGTLPTITTQPASVTTTVGTDASFSVAALAGTNPITYQWLINNVAISGATSASLSLKNLQATDAGSYTVNLTTTAGTVTSTPATLTVNPVPVVVPPTPITAPGSGGGGGGGAPSLWFFATLILLGLRRHLFCSRP